MVKLFKQKRATLSGGVICLLLLIAFSVDRTKAGLFNHTHSYIFKQDYFFSGFHKNGYYLRIGDDFEVFPGVNNLFSLGVFSLKKSAQNYLSRHFPPAKWWFEEDPVQRQFQGKPLCSSVRVDWENSIMQGFLGIHTGCIDDAFPVWQFSAAPSGKRNCMHRDMEFKLDDEELMFCLLWADMNGTGIEKVLLQPFEQEGINKLNLYLCALKEGCYRIDIEMDFGRHSDHPWLLSQLAFQQLPKSGTISALHHQVIKSIVGIIHCLNERDGFPAKGEYFQCEPEQGVFRQAGKYWTYRSSDMLWHYPFAPWFYHGKNIRILPLSTCYKSRNADYHRCNSYIFQGSDYSNQALPTGLGKPVLHIGFDHKFRNYQQQYLNYDLPGIGEYFKPVNYAELVLAIIFGSPLLKEQIVGDTMSGFAQDQHVNPGINDVGFFDTSAVSTVIPVKENVEGGLGYSVLVPDMTNQLSKTSESQGIMARLTSTLQSFNSWRHPESGRENEPDDIVETPGDKYKGKRGNRPPQRGERNPIPRFVAQSQNDRLPTRQNQQGDNDPPNPELPLVAPPSLVAASPDIDDLLRFLQHHGLVPTQFPVSPLILNVLAQSEQPMVVSGVHGNLIQQAIRQSNLLYHPLIHCLPTYILPQISTSWGFKSNLDSHIALLSELLNADIAVLIAQQTGQHLYRRYSIELKGIVQGRVVDRPDHFLGASIILVQSPTGFLKIERLRGPGGQPEVSMVQGSGAGMTVTPEIPALLPTGTGQLIEAYQSWPWFDGGEQEARILFNQIALGDLRDKDLKYMNGVRDYLAHKGHVSYPLKGSLETGQFRFSKTLLEWLEQFWQTNHELLERDNSLFFDGSRHTQVARDVLKAGALRRNLSIGFASEDDFSTVFVDAALPAVKLMADQQKILLTTIAGVVNQFFRTGARIACYGGMAKRSHLIQEMFAGNLAAASEEGALLPVNDVDLMMFNLREMEFFLLQLVSSLSHNFPWLNIVGPSEVITGQEHLTTRKIILYWHGARFFTIDVSHSKQYGYFDFSGVEHQSLFLDFDHSPALPLIGFTAMVRQLVKESFNKGDSPDSERRSYLAQRFLWLLKDSSQYVSSLLSEAYPEEDWRRLFHSVIYGVEKGRVVESLPFGDSPDHSGLLPDDNPDDSGHESADEEFLLPSEPNDMAIEPKTAPEEELLSMVTEPIPDESIPTKPEEQPAEQKTVVVIEKRMRYPESKPVVMPVLHSVELAVDKTWSTETSWWHIPSGMPSLFDRPVLEPVKLKPFSNQKLLAAWEKVRFPKPVEYKKVSPELLSETGDRLEALHNEFLLPAFGVTAIPEMPSELGDYFSDIDRVVWYLAWINDDLKLNDGRWFIPSLPVSVQGKLWLWSALYEGRFFLTGERLQIIQKVNNPKVLIRLYIAMSLGNHIAGYLINELNYYKNPQNVGYYDVMLRRAAPFVPEALVAAVQRMVDVHSRRFDPEGIVKLVRQAVISRQDSFPHDLTGREPVSKTVLAIIKALKVLPEDNPSDRQQEEAASWLLQVLVEPDSGYQPAIIGIMLVTGLESFLPENWKDICAEASPRGQWVCSWAHGGNTPELKDTPAWLARDIRQKDIFSHEEAVAQFFEQQLPMATAGQLLEVFHAGHLLFNSLQWQKGLTTLNSAGGAEAYRYLVNFLGLFDPPAAAARLKVQIPPGIYDRIALGSAVERLQAVEAARSVSSKQRMKLARLYPKLPESMLWSSDITAGEPLTMPEQLGYSFGQAVLTLREQELRQYFLPSHPEFRQLSEKLVFSALVESGARFVRDGNQLQVYVNPSLLAIPHIFQKLQEAAYLNNPEASWLLFLSGRTDQINPALVELKLAAKVIPAARRQAINLLLNEGPLFDPEGLLTLYRDAESVSDTSAQRIYVASDICRGSCLILDQYLQGVANAQSDKEWNEAWQIIADSPVLKLKRISIQHAEVVALMVSGQFQRLDKPVRNKLRKQLKGNSLLAKYLFSFLPDKKEAEIVEAMNGITGGSVDPAFIEETRSCKHVNITGIKAAALARKLAASKRLRTEFSEELARLQDGSGEQKEMARYWLYRVMYSSRFLFNHSLNVDFAQKIYSQNQKLGLVAFGAILSWRPEEYPGMVLRRLMSLNKEWEASSSTELRGIFITGYLNFLVEAAHDELLTKELRKLYSKALFFLKKANNPALVRDVEMAERSYSEPEVYFQEQLDAQLKYSVEWIKVRTQLANIKIEKMLSLLPELEQNRPVIDELTQQLAVLKHPVGLFMHAWLHWQGHRSFTPEILYRYLYPAARQFLPAWKLLFQEYGAIDLSALMIERARICWDNLESASADHEKWSSPFLGLVEESRPDESLLSFIRIVNRAPVDMYLQQSQGLPLPLVSEIHTAAVMKYFNRWLDALATTDLNKHHEATVALDQAIAAFNAVGATARKALFSKLTDSSRIDETIVSRSPFQSDDRILQLSGYLNQVTGKAMKKKVARMLIEEVEVTVSSEQELGWALGWLPQVQQRYQIIPLLVQELNEQGKYTAVAELFEAVKDWSVGNGSKQFILSLEYFIDFMIKHSDHFPEHLESTLELYLAERIQNERGDLPFMAYGAALVLLMYSEIDGDLAIRLHNIISRYTYYQMTMKSSRI